MLRAKGRMAVIHVRLRVCDWLVPTTDLVSDRGMPDEGAIDSPRIRAMAEAAGYRVRGGIIQRPQAPR